MLARSATVPARLGEAVQVFDGLSMLPFFGTLACALGKAKGKRQKEKEGGAEYGVALINR
jgi:hypothetical protein